MLTSCLWRLTVTVATLSQNFETDELHWSIVIASMFEAFRNSQSHMFDKLFLMPRSQAEGHPQKIPEIDSNGRRFE